MSRTSEVNAKTFLPCTTDYYYKRVHLAFTDKKNVSTVSVPKYIFLLCSTISQILSRCEVDAKENKCK